MTVRELVQLHFCVVERLQSKNKHKNAVFSLMLAFTKRTILYFSHCGRTKLEFIHTFSL